MRTHMNATIRFQAPKALKDRFWKLCYERGLLPSQALRQAMVALMERLERNQGTQTNGG